MQTKRHRLACAIHSLAEADASLKIGDGISSATVQAIFDAFDRVLRKCVIEWGFPAGRVGRCDLRGDPDSIAAHFEELAGEAQNNLV